MVTRAIHPDGGRVFRRRSSIVEIKVSGEPRSLTRAITAMKAQAVTICVCVCVCVCLQV